MTDSKPAHPVVHFEIGCTDGEKTREFFSALFDWQISGPESGPESGLAIPAVGEGGIPGHLVELAPEWGNYVTIYVQVQSLETHLEKAESLGGRTLVPPVDIPGQGRFAWLAAPEGNIIGLWESG